MPVHNSEIAEMFNELADLLELQEANQFRVRAYRTAARTVSSLPQSVAEMVKKGEDVSRLRGIGKDLAGKITRIVETGELPQLEEARASVPSGILALTTIAGLGPKRAVALHRELGVVSVEDLERAAEAKKIRRLEGFGEKSEEKILEAIRRRGGKRDEKKRILISMAEEIAEPLLEHLREGKEITHLDPAGSYRRRRETVGDLDILAVSSEPGETIDRFVGYEDVSTVVAKGTTKASVLLRSGFQVDLRVVPEESYGAALHYFTGAKEHTVAVRKIGIDRGLKINEYGVFKDDRRVAGRSEEEVYGQVGLPYFPPEVRENRGEIEVAQDGGLPDLIEIDDIRGDLHIHTSATEGKASLDEMAEAAADRGHEYIAITDHSKHLAMTRGLNEERLAQQIDEIDEYNKRHTKIVVLKGIEVDILEDGSLDLSDDILKRLDIVVGSLHYKFDLSEDRQTERILRALGNPYLMVLGHPSGRLLNQREGYQVDMERVVKAARDRGAILELNAQPERLDLTDTYCKMAKEAGALVVISTDAHSVTDLGFMRFGIAQARRGWLAASDVLNTRSLKELRQILGKKGSK